MTGIGFSVSVEGSDCAVPFHGTIVPFWNVSERWNVPRRSGTFHYAGAEGTQPYGHKVLLTF